MTTVLAGLILLGVLIFFHELGHFLVAKATGVRVLTFSLGFGPRLFGVRVGDTDYRISALPLGGYVRMYGDDIHEEIPESERHRAFLEKPVWQKSAIAFAGPFANFLLPVVILFIAAVGSETVSDPVVGTLLPGEPAAAAGMQVGDRILSVDGHPVTAFGDLQEHIEPRPGEEVRIIVERDGARTDLVVVPRGVKSSHPLQKDMRFGRVGIMPLVPAAQVHVAKESAAAAAGLKEQDRIVTVNGEDVADMRALDAALTKYAGQALTLGVQPAADDTAGDAEGTEDSPRVTTVEIPAPSEAGEPAIVASSEIVRFAVTREELETETWINVLPALERRAAGAAHDLATNRGIAAYEATIAQVAEGSAAHSLGIDEGHRILALDGLPIAHAGEIQTRLEQDADGIHTMLVLKGAEVVPMVFRMGPRPERGLEDLKYLGVVAGSAYELGPTHERAVGVGEALSRALAGTWSLIDETVRGLWALATLQVSPKTLGGPVAIFSLAGQAMEVGMNQFVRLMCLISVNLGVLNLLPVPVLDGGHLLMFAVEAVRRRRLTVEARERALKFGFTALLVLMVAALFNDLMRVFS